MNEVDDLLQELITVESKKKELEAVEEIVKGQLMAIMVRDKISVLENARIQVHLITNQIRRKIDTKRLKQDHPDIAALLLDEDVTLLFVNKPKVVYHRIRSKKF